MKQLVSIFGWKFVVLKGNLSFEKKIFYSRNNVIASLKPAGLKYVKTYTEKDSRKQIVCHACKEICVLDRKFFPF